MARTAALYAFPALLVVSAWMGLERGVSSNGAAFWLALLALAPALVGPARGRAVAAGLVSLLAVHTAFGLSPLDARPLDGSHDYAGPLLSRLSEGVLDFYDVTVPFAPGEQPLMRGVVLLAAFASCLVLALGIAARRPLLAASALVAGAAWPATLASGGGDLLRGILILAGVLLLLAWAGRRTPHAMRPAALAALGLAAAALAVTTSPAVAKGAFLSWKTWDPYDQPDDPVGVRYVWDASYGGIRFPKKVTTVLRVKGPPRALYWRATTLDVFVRDRWLEQLPQIATSSRPHDVLADPLLPAAAHLRDRWTQADVRVEALRDRRLPGPSMPVRYHPRGAGEVEYRTGGVAVLPDELRRDQTYTVWAYAPRPTPRQLARSVMRPQLRGTAVSPYLELAPGAPVLPLGTPGREQRVRTLVANPSHAPVLEPYEPLFRRAREVVGSPDTPYAAAVALEAWFRLQGGFTYDEQPPVRPGTPPLVSFVTDTKRGYCQHFAGAMTLMLRYLGIPARVAVGFTSGDYDAGRQEWVVSDHDAHAWVEVWFERWGWLPFDPTPGRGRLSGTYTTASQSFDSRAAQQAAGGGGGPRFAILGELLRSRVEGTGGPGGDVPGDLGGGAQSGRVRGASLLRLLGLALVLLVGGIALLKLVVRRTRFLTSDPRRIAGACRRELVDLLADQGVPAARSATLADLADLVSSRLHVDADAFGAAVGAARFARPREARAAAREARRELRALRRRVRRRLGIGARARGLVSLRSLGLGA